MEGPRSFGQLSKLTRGERTSIQTNIVDFEAENRVAISYNRSARGMDTNDNRTTIEQRSIVFGSIVIVPITIEPMTIESYAKLTLD